MIEFLRECVIQTEILTVNILDYHPSGDGDRGYQAERVKVGTHVIECFSQREVR